MIEVVYSGRDNVASIVVKQDGQPLDFSAVTRMTLELRGQGVVADTDVDASLIGWGAGGGRVEFDLGDRAIDIGTYDATLVAYDPAHPDGQVLAHPSGASLKIKIVR